MASLEHPQNSFEAIFERMPKELRSPEALFEDFKRRFPEELKAGIIGSNKTGWPSIKHKMLLTLNSLNTIFSSCTSWEGIGETTNTTLDEFITLWHFAHANDTTKRKPFHALGKMWEPYCSLIPSTVDFHLKELSEFATYLKDAQCIELWIMVQGIDKAFETNNQVIIRSRLQEFQDMYISQFIGTEDQCKLVADFDAIIGHDDLLSDFVGDVRNLIDWYYDSLNVEKDKRKTLNNTPSIQRTAEHVSRELQAIVPIDVPGTSSGMDLLTDPSTVTLSVLHDTREDDGVKVWTISYPDAPPEPTVIRDHLQEHPRGVDDLILFFENSTGTILWYIRKLEWNMGNEQKIAVLENQKNWLLAEMREGSLKIKDLREKVEALWRDLERISKELDEVDLDPMKQWALTIQQLKVETELELLKGERSKLQKLFTERYGEISEELKKIDWQITALGDNTNNDSQAQLERAQVIFGKVQSALAQASDIKQAIRFLELRKQ